MMKKRKFVIFTGIIISILFINILPIFNGKNLYKYISNSISKRTVKESLSVERQNNFDKMKIEYVEIANRLTGTAPFNSGSVSTADGIDVSNADDYVRTFDSVSYTVEVGVSANTSLDGVTESSSFSGGVIKIKAKLPNQGDLVNMTWEKDAWMQNVQYNSDKTEIYAEYHVPSGTSITNATQNLTFTASVGGYKNDITDDMAPEFEVWMEGNKPDNDSSNIESVSVKDTERNLIISGKYSFDARLAKGQLNHYRELDNQEGYYINATISILLKQPYSEIDDLRGTLYPKGKITVKLNGEYMYGGKVVNEENMNGAKIIALGVNGKANDAFYPQKTATETNSFYGKRSYGHSYDSAYDSGTITGEQGSNFVTIDFSDYKFDGIFPYRSINSASVLLNKDSGLFTVGNLELFVPLYEPTESEAKNKDHKFNLYFSELNVSDGYTVDYSNETDAVSDNNSRTYNLKERAGTIFAALRAYELNKDTYLSSSYYAEDSSIIAGDEFNVEVNNVATTGPYRGGAVSFFAWNTSYFELIKHHPYGSNRIEIPGGYASLRRTNNLGFDVTPYDQIKMYYGVLKNNPQNGIVVNEEVITSSMDDFDWYTSYDDATTHGKVAAIKFDDPQNIGDSLKNRFLITFRALNNVNNISTTGAFFHYTTYYNDAERKSTSYGKQTYKMTVYSEDGHLLSKGNEAFGETILITGLNTNVKLAITDKDSDNKVKTNYDVQDSEINLSITPTLTNKKEATDSDKVVDSVLVTTTLPIGLNYKSGSANKEPKSVVVNADGTTTIIWEYKNWKVNHEPNEDPVINFAAEISSSIDNNKSLEIKTIIFNEQDLRNIDEFRTSKVSVKISNLAGARAAKELDKNNLEKNEKFTVTTSIGNSGQDNLVNVKTLDILPKNNDVNGSSFDGEYTVKMTKLLPNQRVYYSTNSIDNIGIQKDKYGKDTVKEVDFQNDSRWIEVSVNDVIPKNATAVATVIEEINTGEELSYKYEVIPTNNSGADKYIFMTNITSDTLSQAIKTNTVRANVVKRSISGKVFIDKNKNMIYDKSDELLTNKTVTLLDENKNVVSTTTTNTKGEYIFDNLDKNDYYIQYVIPTNYKAITKGTVSASSKINATGLTDLITKLNTNPSDDKMSLMDLNIGIVRKEATLTVHHYIKDTTTSLSEDVVETVYYGDTYKTSVAENIPKNYELKTIPTNATGTVSQDDIEVRYIYEKKKATVNDNLEVSTGTTLTNKESKVQYKIKYETNLTDFIGNAKLKVVSTLPYEIDTSDSQLDGGVYDQTQKTITWILDWNDVNTYDSENSKSITKEISVLYKDIDQKQRTMINSVKASTILDGTEETSKTEQSTTNIEIKGKITVKYLTLVNGEEKELEESFVAEELIGTKVNNPIKNINGYKLVTDVTSTELEFKETEQVIKYYYEKVQITSNSSENGIDGDIKVNYNDDGKLESIEIVPPEGNKVSSIIIDGKEIEIPSPNFGNKIVIDDLEDVNLFESLEVNYEKLVITTTPSESGTDGDVKINYDDDGKNVSIEITPTKGNKVSSIIINGQEIKLPKANKNNVIKLKDLDKYGDIESLEIKYAVDEENPNTLDNIVKYAIIFASSLLSVVVLAIFLKKKNRTN